MFLCYKKSETISLVALKYATLSMSFFQDEAGLFLTLLLRLFGMSCLSKVRFLARFDNIVGRIVACLYAQNDNMNTDGWLLIRFMNQIWMRKCGRRLCTAGSAQLNLHIYIWIRQKHPCDSPGRPVQLLFNSR